MRATPSRPLTTPLISALSVAAVTLAVLAGCTPTAVHKATPKPTPSASASAEKAPGITDITDTPGSGAGLVGALADSKVTACALTDGAWNVTGTVTNPTPKTVHYRIYVSLLDGAGGTRALQQVDVDTVKSSATADWKTSIPTTEDGLNCVLRVERYGA